MSASGPRSVALIAALALLATAPACSGEFGTLAIELVTAPGSTVMDPVVRGRLTLSDPPAVFETERGADGRLSFELEVVAEGFAGYLSFEGFDQAGELVAYGRTGPVPIAAINAEVALYVAAPMSFALAPVELPGPRADLGGAPLPYGALLAGGVDELGLPTDDLSIYSVYDHTLQAGEPLPLPRRAPTVIAGDVGYVYIFGGADEDDAPRHELWRFDTNAAPAGRYDGLTSSPALARIGAAATSLFDETFLVAGDPVAIIDGAYGVIEAAPNAPTSSGEMTSILVNRFPRALIVGSDAAAAGAMLYKNGLFEPLQVPASTARNGHGAVLLRDSDTLIVGGATAGGLETSAVRLDTVSETYTEIEGVLPSPRRFAAIAATPDHLIVAGGLDETDSVLADAVVIDLATLTPIATIPLVAGRAGARAFALSNGQVLVAGGRAADGTPLSTIELFTPTP